jgi:class 3 adenylate cyclase
MDRVGAWIWRRHREHFVEVTLVIATAGLAVALIPPSTAAGGIFLDISAAETLIWSAAVTLSLAITAGLMYLPLRRHLEPVRRYVRGDSSVAGEAWEALLVLPQLLGVRGFVTVVPISLVVSLPVVLHYADLGPTGVIGLVYSYLVVVVSGVALLVTGTQLLVEAPAAELSAGLEAMDVPRRGAWTIRRRLIAIMFVSTTFTGVATAGVVLGTSATENDYLVSFLASALLTVYLIALVDNGIFQPTVKPVQRLIDATVRVRRGDLSAPVVVYASDELGQLSAAFNEMQAGLRDRAALHAAFGSYVDPALAERLLASGSAVFDGEELDVTVMFADVRDFTSFSERIAPAEAVTVLNLLFDVIVPVVHEHGGHANHYLGDGLLAAFGAPQPLERHADAAVSAAVEIQQRVRAKFGADLRLGIGINTGPVIAGTVGGGGRHEFTVIGDTVNVASRVEQLTKETGDAILITEATRVAVSTPRPRTTKRGDFEVRGKALKVTLHAVNPFPRSPGRSRSYAQP